MAFKSYSDGEILYASDFNRSLQKCFFQGAFETTLNHLSVNVSNSATVIKAANSSRTAILVKNSGTASVFLGVSSGVTTANGYELESGKSIYLINKEAIYGITASTTEDIRILEVQ